LALFNESLEGRFSRLIGALHNMKGPNPAPQVTPEITHVISISDDMDRAVHYFLEGTTRYSSGRIAVAGDATHFGVIQFLNPVGSGILVVVEKLLLEVPAAGGNGFMSWATAGVAALVPGSTGNSFPLDTRESSSKQSALQNIANGAALAGGCTVSGTLTTSPKITIVQQ